MHIDIFRRGNQPSRRLNFVLLTSLKWVCFLKKKKKLCNNFIKSVIHRPTDKDLYICGTYSFQPRLFQFNVIKKKLNFHLFSKLTLLIFGLLFSTTWVWSKKRMVTVSVRSTRSTRARWFGSNAAIRSTYPACTRPRCSTPRPRPNQSSLSSIDPSWDGVRKPSSIFARPNSTPIGFTVSN